MLHNYTWGTLVQKQCDARVIVCVRCSKDLELGAFEADETFLNDPPPHPTDGGWRTLPTWQVRGTTLDSEWLVLCQLLKLIRWFVSKTVVWREIGSPHCEREEKMTTWPVVQIHWTSAVWCFSGHLHMLSMIKSWFHETGGNLRQTKYSWSIKCKSLKTGMNRNQRLTNQNSRHRSKFPTLPRRDLQPLNPISFWKLRGFAARQKRSVYQRW